MRIEFGFEVCRVCLFPVTAMESSSLFDKNGKNVEMFQVITGIDVSLLFS